MSWKIPISALAIIAGFFFSSIQINAEDHKALDPFAVYGGNWFHFKNCWVLVNRGTDSEFTHPFDLNEYEEYSEFRANKPEQWLYGFRLRFIGASEEDVKNQPDFFSDPNEAFTRTGSYRIGWCSGRPIRAQGVGAPLPYPTTPTWMIFKRFRTREAVM